MPRESPALVRRRPREPPRRRSVRRSYSKRAPPQPTPSIRLRPRCSSCSAPAARANPTWPPVSFATGRPNSARRAPTYTTAADFRHRLNDAIKRQAELAFRDEFRGSELLVIDDLQHLPADDYAFQELRYTLDDYEDRGATVIITSSEAVNLLPNLPADLRSRLSAGLALQLAARSVPLACESSTTLQPRSTARFPATLPSDLPRASKVTPTTCFVRSSSSARPAATPSARKLADDLLAAHAARRPRSAKLPPSSPAHQNVPQSQLKSSSRKQSIVFARGLIVFLARELADLSYEEIGRALGGRDHTTIIHNYRKIAHECETNPQTAQSLETLRRLLLSR